MTGVTANKVYDGYRLAATLGGTASVTTGRGPGSGHRQWVPGSGSHGHVGMGKAVTVTVSASTGGDAGNYSIVQPSTGLTANITLAPLECQHQQQNRQYDGTTNASGTAVTGRHAVRGRFAHWRCPSVC